jgi:kumamolisin
MAKNERFKMTGSEHTLPAGSIAQRRTNPNKWLEVTLGVRRKQDLPDLSAMAAVLPKDRKYMTHDTLSQEYGSDPQSVERIKTFAKQNNLTVVREDSASARLSLAGTVGDLTAAFGVTLFDYQHPTLGDFHARTEPVSVPPALKDDITGVFGFNNHRILRRKHHAAAAMRGTPSPQARAWFVATELEPVYNFPATDGAGQCIALLEFGGGVDNNDQTTYFQTIKQTNPDVQVIGLDGVSTDPASDPDSTGEVMLDIEIAGTMAPGAKIAVYFSTFDEKGLIDALSAVIGDTTNKPSVMSISWGWAENQPFNNTTPWSPAAIDHVNHSFLAAAQLGITTCVSTGDDGSEAQIKDGSAHVNFPATSPYVLAVGGTTLHVRKDTSGQTTVIETVWNDGPGSGTGGGVSDITPVPTWQSGIVPASINSGNFAGRAIPDVAANADPATGYFTVSGGKQGIVGGTSASAPLWASLIARINALLKANVGNFNALLYSKFGPAGVLRDITAGNNDTSGLLNGQFPAGPGWDACTGWGVPDGAKLLSAFEGPAPK